MIPTPRALAESAMRRQEDLSRQLAKAQTTSGASFLPDVLRRAIVTVSVCHETLRALEAAMESGSKPSSHRFPGLLNFLNDAVGPFGLDANDHRSRDVGIAPDAGQSSKRQFEVLAELKAPVSVGQSHRSLDQ